MVRTTLVSILVAVSAFGQTAQSTQARLERRFAELRKDPPSLYAFLYRMPKGGDLHNHLSGAIYAESFLSAAAAHHLCIDKSAMAIVASPCKSGQVDAALTQTDNDLRNAMIDSLSMRGFVPGRESGHGHFFAAFDKFGPVDTAELIGEVVRRAGDQNESYVELMALSGGGAVSELGKTAGLDNDFDVTRQKLDAGGLSRLITELRSRVDELEEDRRRALDCDKTPGGTGCRVQVHYIYQVLREFPKEQVFAQVLAGFALATAEPRVVGINLVQPEDGATSMRDYHLQMRMVEYAKRVYPSVHVTLHAGELAPGLVPPDGLRFHVREAVELGHAERIGHGVDIMSEKDPEDLLKQMHDKRIAVEINLTSNDLILGVRGDDHPFSAYRQAGVPVVISTDDEGISRSQLTDEFQRAALTYKLTYQDLKDIVRNSLEFSFAQGDSYWAKGAYGTPVAACFANKQSPVCQDYLLRNEKARLEADLEDRFAEFEKANLK